MAATDGASSISVAIRVRPFTVCPLQAPFFRTLAHLPSQVREAAQLTQVPDGPLFLGDGSLAGAPAPLLKTKGIRPVLKVVDDKCL